MELQDILSQLTPQDREWFEKKVNREQPGPLWFGPLWFLFGECHTQHDVWIMRPIGSQTSQKAADQMLESWSRSDYVRNPILLKVR